MAQKYYQQPIQITGQTATHATNRNWLLQLDVGDILIIGPHRAAITALESANRLTFLGDLPQGSQLADFEVANKSVFSFYPKGRPARGVRLSPPESYPVSRACVRCDIGSQGKQGVPGERGGRGEPGPPGAAATSLDALTDVVASAAVEGQAYTLLKQNGKFTLVPAVTDVTDEWVTNW